MAIHLQPVCGIDPCAPGHVPYWRDVRGYLSSRAITEAQKLEALNNFSQADHEERINGLRRLAAVNLLHAADAILPFGADEHRWQLIGDLFGASGATVHRWWRIASKVQGADDALRLAVLTFPSASARAKHK